MEANQLLRARLSSAVSTSLEDVNTANRDLLSAIDSKISYYASSPMTFFITYLDWNTNVSVLSLIS